MIRHLQFYLHKNCRAAVFRLECSGSAAPTEFCTVCGLTPVSCLQFEKECAMIHLIEHAKDFDGESSRSVKGRASRGECKPGASSLRGRSLQSCGWNLPRCACGKGAKVNLAGFPPLPGTHIKPVCRNGWFNESFCSSKPSSCYGRGLFYFKNRPAVSGPLAAKGRNAVCTAKCRQTWI